MKKGAFVRIDVRGAVVEERGACAGSSRPDLLDRDRR
jgi:hypothetical protein